MKKTSTLKRVVCSIVFFGSFLLVHKSFAQLPANINTPQSRADYDDFNRIIAETYAPTFTHLVETQDWEVREGILQDEFGIRDLIVRLDYDGDWIMNNNWENYYGLRDRLVQETKGQNFTEISKILGRTPELRPRIYYMVSWTACEWVITYTFFHAIDWNNCDILPLYSKLDEHENDTEGVVIHIDRTNFDISKITTIYHNETIEATGKQILTSGNSSLIKIYNQTHSAVPTGNDPGDSGCHTSANITITYDFAGRNLWGTPNPAALDYINGSGHYDLVDIYAKGELWDRRFDREVMTEDGRLIGEDGADDNKARAPWAWPFLNTCTPTASLNCDKVIWIWQYPIVWGGALQEFAPCDNVCFNCSAFNEDASSGLTQSTISPNEQEDQLPLIHDLFLYPNPVSNNSTLTVGFKSKSINRYIQIYGPSGDLVKEINTTNTIISIDVSPLHSGIYHIKCVSEKESIVKKFVVQ